LDWNKIGHRHLDGFEKPKNGESIDELNNRIRNFLQNIKKRYPNNNVLVVSHDTFIRNLIRIIKETPNFKGIRNEEIYKINI
jgi:broad specificity phosphatase PhoE